MHTPAGAPRLPVEAKAAVFAACLLAGATLPAETGSAVRQALHTELPRYDPKIRAAYLASRAAQEAKPAPAAAPRESAPAPPAPEAPADDTVVLPKMTVHADRVRPPPLPRLDFARPFRDLKGEPLESPSARTERLIKKHFTPFERALNRFALPLFGVSLAGLAQQAEAREQHARQLNDLAESIELAALAGVDPALQERMRREYLKVYYSPPR